MTHFFKTLLVGLSVVIGMSACSSTGGTINDSESRTPASDTPMWFVSSGFSSDSLSFYGYANAIEADSIIAIANARLQAKANLESALANELEEVRKDINSQMVSQTNFIISLRNAHQMIQNRAQSSNGKAVKKEGHYVGFSQVSITKKDVEELIRSGLSANKRYQAAFAESEAFKAFIQ